MRSGGVHHVDLVVSSIERSLPFYRDLLGPLGWHGISEVEGERGETTWYLLGHETQIGLRESQTPSTHDRYAIGLHHLAFEAGDKLANFVDAAWQKGKRVILATKRGNPSTEIVAYAKEQGIDLIVMSTHGRAGLPHVLVGSVAERVIQTAPCPVLTMRPSGHPASTA